MWLQYVGLVSCSVPSEDVAIVLQNAQLRYSRVDIVLPSSGTYVNMVVPASSTFETRCRSWR